MMEVVRKIQIYEKKYQVICVKDALCPDREGTTIYGPTSYMQATAFTDGAEYVDPSGQDASPRDDATLIVRVTGVE